VTTYSSKPSLIEAVQWTGDNIKEIADFGVAFRSRNPEWALEILAGKDGAQDFVPVPVGHWVVRAVGDLTDHWPVDPDYFANKYEEATP
jgi:hypothetical protein